MPDSFVDPKRVTKSYIPAANAPIRIDVQEGHNQVATESRTRLKHGRQIGSKDKNPRKTKKCAENESEAKEILDMAAVEPKALDMAEPKVPNNDAWAAKLQGTKGPDNNEISINYALSGIQWNRENVDIDDIFACNIALEIMI